jgi:hypothetical protein
MADPRIMLTFDYELFLGRHSGSAEKCIIVPTREILKRVQAHDATALFFVDATYLARIEASDAQAYAMVASQIEEMLESGCEVGFHLHPHWLDAVQVDAGGWSLENTRKYRLHALEQGELSRVFCDSFASLERVVRRVSSSCRINTFRAGGWCLQPFTTLRSSFEELGIEYDFSVTPGFYKNNLPAHFYDYRQAPKDSVVWRFTDDPCVPQSDGKFVEVPVTAFRATLPSLVLNKLRLRGQSIYGDGQGVGGASLRDLASKMFAAEGVRQLTLDMCSRELLEISLRKTEGRNLRVFASHPKIMSASAIDNLELLLQRFQTVRLDELTVGTHI